MDWITLGNPTPRESELPYSEFEYKVVSKTYLPEPEIPISVSFGSILADRRSMRTFKPVSGEKKNALLWYSSRVITLAPAAHVRWQHRPCPSAGGRHPIDILVIERRELSKEVFLYDPVSHGLSELAIDELPALSQLIAFSNEVVPLAGATMIWFGAQFERTLSKYENGESLVWRDAGVLIATISFVAEALDLNCCALGISGEPFFSQMLNSQRKVTGVGGLLIGERASNVAEA
jgi:SagB-type dehydrogenase family enzyme